MILVSESQRSESLAPRRPCFTLLLRLGCLDTCARAEESQLWSQFEIRISNSQDEVDRAHSPTGRSKHPQTLGIPF